MNLIGGDFLKSKVVIIAHDHPAIGIREEMRMEKIKCFLKGRWKSKKIIQMPSLTFITGGTDVLQERALSQNRKRQLKMFIQFEGDKTNERNDFSRCHK